MTENDQGHEEGITPVEVLESEEAPRSDVPGQSGLSMSKHFLPTLEGRPAPDGAVPATIDHPQAAPALPAQLEAAQVVDQVRLIQEVMQSVMKEGIDGHYGKIPGCGDKPTLLKAGAEKLSLTFRMAPKYKITVRNLELPGLPLGHREVEIVCSLYHIGSGNFLGEGVGTCSTMEAKYRYRDKPLLCPECKKPSVIKGKDEYGGGWLCWKKKDGCGSKWPDGDKAIEGQETGKIENDNPADVWNTVLKIGKKRAHVDAVLTATAASDIFTQDIEDLPKGGSTPPPTDPEPKPDDVPVQKAPPKKRAAPKKAASRPDPTPASSRGTSTPPPASDPSTEPAGDEPRRNGAQQVLDPLPDPPEPIYSFDDLEGWADGIWNWWKSQGWSDAALAKAARDKNAMPVYCHNSECRGPCYERERGYDQFVCMGKSGTTYCPELDENGEPKLDKKDKPYRLGWRKAGETYPNGEWFDRSEGGWPYRVPTSKVES